MQFPGTLLGLDRVSVCFLHRSRSKNVRKYSRKYAQRTQWLQRWWMWLVGGWCQFVRLPWILRLCSICGVSIFLAYFFVWQLLLFFINKLDFLMRQWIWPPRACERFPLLSVNLVKSQQLHINWFEYRNSFAAERDARGASASDAMHRFPAEPNTERAPFKVQTMQTVHR